MKALWKGGSWGALTLVLIGGSSGCSIPESCPGSVGGAMEDHIGDRVSLRDLTDFPWVRAYFFRSGEPAERVREVSGLDYRPYRDRVPDGLGVFAFETEASGFCLATWNAYEVDFSLDADWAPAGPWFEVIEGRPKP